MAVAAVVATTTNTRVNNSDTNTSWGNWGSGGGAPASEAQLAYLGTAVNTKVNTTTLDGIDYDPAAGAVDMTSTSRQLWIVKVIVADSFDLNTSEGVRVGIGSGNADYRVFNIAGSAANGVTDIYDEYPAQGGYLITAVNPDANTTYQEVADTGTPVWTGVDWFGVQCAMAVGAAKSENLAMDSIDVGTGLQIHAGTGADPDCNMSDFVIADQGTPGTPGTRWGYVTTRGGIIFVLGRLDVGVNGASAAVTEFTDNESIVVFNDAYYAAGDAGFLFDISNASTIINAGITILGRGALVGSDDTRPDHTVTGTAGAYTFTGTMRNHRLITFTSACVISGATIECQDLVQGTASIEDGSTVITTSAANTATCADPTFGATTDLNNMTFQQGGAGHAIEFGTPSTVTMTNVQFTGYNASDGQSDSAIFNDSGGLMTINLASGSLTPSVRNGTSATTAFVNAKTVRVTTLDGSATAVASARVFVEADTGGPLPADASVTITNSGAVATVSHTAHGLETGDVVAIRGAVNDDEYNGLKTITVTGVNAYTYVTAGTPASPATGTITSTAVVLTGLTNGSGILERTDFNFSTDQPVRGWARNNSSPFYGQGPISGTITTDGLSLVVALSADA